jgi:1,4-dihydroxy-2-naphthoate octaprenyltransferase
LIEHISHFSTRLADSLRRESVGSYVAVTLFVLARLLPLYSLAVWITFPLALSNVRSVLMATDRKAFAIGIKRTATLHLQFAALLALGITVAALSKSLFSHHLS